MSRSPAVDSGSSPDAKADGGVVDSRICRGSRADDAHAESGHGWRGRPQHRRRRKNSSREPWFKSMALRCDYVRQLYELRATLPSNKLLQTAQLRLRSGPHRPRGASKAPHLFGRESESILTSIRQPNAAERARRSLRRSPSPPRAPNFVAGLVVTFDGVNFRDPLRTTRTSTRSCLRTSSRLGFLQRDRAPAPAGQFAAHLVHGRKPNGAAFVRHPNP